jgi:hypothetical protein
MKQSFFTLLFALLMAASATSQISLRPQVGVNVPSVTSDDIKGNLGFQFGADLQIGESFYVQPGVNFQTGKLTLEGAGDMNLSRINIPVMVGFALGEAEDASFGFRVFAGPNLAFHADENLDDLSVSDITGDNFKSAVFSGQVGAGLDISVLFIDVAYQFGLSNYIEGTNRVEDSKKHMFLANAGIRIGF